MIYNSIAAVLPRYGASLGGGAETLVRELLLHLKDVFKTVSVYTTTATDHRTWKNELEEGTTIEDGINVHRFKVDERNLERFIHLEQKIHAGYNLSAAEQISWLEQSVNSSGLYSALLKDEKDLDLVLFAPYLFGTTFFGASLIPDKAILLPCLHDEAYAYQAIFRNIFSKCKGIVWNAAPEAELAKSIYSLPSLDDKGFEVGMGFSNISSLESDSVKKNTIHKKPYILYSGRKETGKNLHYLIECYEEYRINSSNPVDLVIIGSGKIDFRENLPEGVFDYGFVSESDKIIFLSNAIALYQPSVNESFSIVMMEAWIQGTPVVSFSEGVVTSYHIKESGGGLVFSSRSDFSSTVGKLINTEERNKLGELGREYVKNKYSWDAVVNRFTKACQQWLMSK